MKLRQYKKIFLLLCVVFVLAAFLGAAFHMHADGEHSGCQTCGFVRTFAALFVFAAAMLIAVLRKQAFFSLQPVRVRSRMRAIPFEGRAPPRLPSAF